LERLERNSHSVRPIRHRRREAQEDQDGKREERPAARDHVQDAGKTSNNEENYIANLVRHQSSKSICTGFATEM
jgi:hypothetical protein